MPGRGLLARVLTVFALVVAGALAVVGGLALRGSGLAAVLLAGSEEPVARRQRRVDA